MKSYINKTMRAFLIAFVVMGSVIGPIGIANAASSSVAIGKENITINVGESTTLKVVVSPANATNKKVKWTSSNTKIVKVSSTGKVTGVANGKAIVTATSVSNNRKDTIIIKVVTPVSSVKLNRTTLDMIVGQSASLLATVSPNSASNKAVNWSSSDKKIATVNATGKVTAISNGAADITVTTADGKKKTTAKVTVTTAVEDIAVDKSSVNLHVGNTTQVTATVLPVAASNQAVTWESSDKSIATVSQSGKITGVKAGQATISVTSEEGEFTAVVIVSVTKGAVAKSVKEIFDDVNPLVAYVECYDSSNKLQASGSGFLIDKSGTFVTNYHVVSNSTPYAYVNIKFGDGTTYKKVKTIIGYDDAKDIAVLKIPNYKGNRAVSLGNSDTIATGEEVIAIGSPLGLENTVSTGIISAKSRQVDGTTYIQTSAQIDHGSSGGVLLNMAGEVIGITSAGFTSSADLNLAIPINQLKSLKQNKNVNINTLKAASAYDEVAEKESNDDFTEAQKIEAKQLVLTGSFKDSSDEDYFKITLKGDAAFGLIGQLEGKSTDATGYLGLTLYDDSGQQVAKSYPQPIDVDGTGNYVNVQYVYEDLQAGTYYVKIAPKRYSSAFDQEQFKYEVGLYLE
jgi:uncharacterized protein YjdB